ncbi:hypothetical protein [Aeromonas jandaei]|uniref:hypothetical protein n=1 Tax=Aeromonas jandaei TaxID=650 RepID=UPI003BA0BB82
MMSSIWRMFPFVCIFGVVILLQQKKIQSIELTRLHNLIDKQNAVLIEQENNIHELNRLHQENEALIVQVQSLRERYQDEKVRVGYEVRREISHEVCRTVKLPDTVAKRMLKFASSDYAKP